MAAQASSAIDLEREPSLEATPTPADIAALAYELWEKRGCPFGSPETDWFEAEQQLSAAAHGKYDAAVRSE